MKQALATVGLGPLLLLQGAYVRRVTPHLPEAEGPRRGEAGAGRPLRLLVTGDSAAAGVGVTHQGEALAGRLTQALTGEFRVRWMLEARTGRTTADTLAHLAQLPAQPFDVVLTSLGVNDVTGSVGLSRWIAQQRALVDLLRDKFSARHVLLSALPPLHEFPALPQPLRWYLGARAQRFNAALAEWAPAQGCHVLAPRFVPDSRAMASDGFHPGPASYAVWADMAAQRIRALHGI
ncbi:MAG TPA: SGNH/GDSL hydrolase family protein [Moraxellaceae bacterium]|nr:SGNH/GDSL hydrolase family protein [Moraxellaceae bacterium]